MPSARRSIRASSNEERLISPLVQSSAIKIKSFILKTLDQSVMLVRRRLT
jgi:hypothetical protein